MREDERSLWVRFASLTLVAVVLIGLDFFPVLKPLRVGSEAVLAPLRRTALALGDRVRLSGEAIVTFRTAHRRILDLERRVAELAVTAAQTEQVIKENEALRKLLGTKEPLAREAVPALVVGRNDLWLVDVGEGEGVKVGAAVVTEEGALIGIVDFAREFVSGVRLLTHPRLTLAVITNNGSLGEIRGEAGELKLAGILQEAPLEVGDKVMTTGEEGMVPPGIVVGTVERVDVVPSAVYKTARVRPLFTESATYVFIIQSSEE